MKISFGFSHCPNDTFMFYAIYEGKVKIPGVTEIEFVIEDIEELNKKAISRELDITKVSANTLKNLTGYLTLRHGAAFGIEEGPVVVAKDENIKPKRLAIPGENTTAYLLYKKFFGKPDEVIELKYDEIIDAVLNDKADAGILIHEGRFIYKEAGLKLIADLGIEWKEKFNLPVPLGVIVAKTELASNILNIEKAIEESIKYAYQNKEEVMPFVKKHASDLSDDIIEQHIKAFVNELSINMGKKGIDAISKLITP